MICYLGAIEREDKGSGRRLRGRKWERERENVTVMTYPRGLDGSPEEVERIQINLPEMRQRKCMWNGSTGANYTGSTRGHSVGSSTSQLGLLFAIKVT